MDGVSQLFNDLLTTTSEPYYSQADNHSMADFPPTDISAEPTSTDIPFFKANLTFKKFFNTSIPINEKINFDLFDSKRNLTEEINKLDFIPPIHPSTNFALFLCSLVFAMFWVTYIAFFNSRVVGSLATHLANKFLHKFVTGGYVKVGSLSFSVLAGKVMFRDLVILTPDMSLRAQDGYFIFRWWRTYVPKVCYDK